MLDRVMITLIIIAGLGLLWFAWQYHKVKIIAALQPIDVVADRPNLLYFTGEYCAACKFQQTPIVEAISVKFGDSIAIKKYDVSTHPELASRYKVLTLPTTVIVNKVGQITHVNHGLARQEKLEAQLAI